MAKSQKGQRKMDKKAVYVKKGDRLMVECLVDRESGEGYFLIQDEDGKTNTAKEIVAEGVRFSSDQRTREVYQMADGTWAEHLEMRNALAEGKELGVEIMTIPFTAPLPTN